MLGGGAGFIPCVWGSRFYRGSDWWEMEIQGHAWGWGGSFFGFRTALLHPNTASLGLLGCTSPMPPPAVPAVTQGTAWPGCSAAGAPIAVAPPLHQGLLLQQPPQSSRIPHSSRFPAPPPHYTRVPLLQQGPRCPSPPITLAPPIAPAPQ